MLLDANHKSILMRPLEKLSGLPSPYGFIEGLGCLYRESNGPATGGLHLPYPPKTWRVNEGVTEETVVGFIGDILDTKGMTARIESDVAAFFGDCDAVVGNFESIITDQPGHGTSVRHIPQIVEALAATFDPATTYLSIANNHAGDYPAAILTESVRMLEGRGFHVFGLHDSPFADLGDHIRVVGATDWSNAPCSSVAMLEGASTPLLAKPGAFNILFPHWGYELELNPRRSMIRKTKAWLDKGFDAVVAHHGHTPRTMYAVKRGGDSPDSLVVDSLGDFVCGFTQEWYHYGIVLKVGLGRNASGRIAAGRTSWEFCETRRSGEMVTTTLRPDLSPAGLTRLLLQS